MRRVCAWCRNSLDGQSDDGSPVTHGICPQCLDYIQADKTSIRGFLNTIDTPVLAVDGEGRVISANRLARLALGKEHSQIADKPGGEVIECQHSLLPEGCGKTIHCTGCQIRSSVNHTRATGEALQQVKARQGIMTPTGTRMFFYYISTEKLGEETVLLRMEQAVSFPR